MKSRVYKFHGLNANCRGHGKVETSTAIKHFINQFGLRGVTITTIHGDNEFEKIKTLVSPVPVECCARDEHVPDIERAVCTVKERSRCSTQSLPFKRIPGIMIDANIQDKVTWLNQFTPHDYISNTIGPAGMILGSPPVNYHNLKLDFGQYCQVHDGTDNTQSAQSVGAIALCPKNTQGSYYFMSLATGKQIHSNNWVELAITPEVIACVEALAAAEGISPLINGELTFEWSPGVVIHDTVQEPLPNAAGLHPTPLPQPSPIIYHDVDPPSENQGAQDGESQGASDRSDNQNTDDTMTIVPVTDDTSPTDLDVDPELDPEYLSNADPFESNPEIVAPEPTNTDKDNASVSDDKSSVNSVDDYVEAQGALTQPAETSTSQPLELPTSHEQLDSSSSVQTRPTRTRKPPQNYTPSFGGKKYSMQLFNLHIKNMVKNEE